MSDDKNETNAQELTEDQLEDVAGGVLNTQTTDIDDLLVRAKAGGPELQTYQGKKN